MANTNDPAGQNDTAGQTPRVVTPEEIQRQEFGVSRFGGYRMRDVDEFLDMVTTSTQSLIAENERLRAAGGPIVGSPDLDEVNRQADEIIQRAREEAARIVAEASASPAAAAAVAATATPGSRPAVDAFLTKERDFLQSLATLVQGHAEDVKGMARRARQAPPGAAGATAEAASAMAPDDAVVDVTDADQPTRVDTPPARPERGADAAPPVADRAESDAVGEHRTPPARGEADGGEGDPSLRALFWGDDT
jgi:DivIVA domain-containing protein